MNTRPARLARGTVAAMFSALVAALGHAAGGGQFPPAVLLIAAGLFSVLVSTALAGRAVSWWRLTISVAFSQVAFHLIFSTSTGSATSPSSATQHGHHGVPILTAATAAGHETADHSGMLLAHVIAAGVTVAALRFGEAAFWDLLRVVVVAISSALRAPRRAGNWMPPRKARPASTGTTLRPRSAVLRVGHPFRGPPIPRPVFT